MSTFLPRDINGWLALIIIVGGFIATFWKGYNTIVAKINGLGERTNMLEQAHSNKEARLATLEQSKRDSIVDRANMHQMIGELKKSVEHTDDSINDMKIEIVQHIADLNRTILADTGKIRERVVRMETLSQIERKIGRPITELEE